MAQTEPDFEPLREFLKSLSTPEKDAFVDACETSIGYLHKAISNRERMREALVIDMERESGGKVRCESLRPDVDWAYLRGSTVVPSRVARRKRA